MRIPSPQLQIGPIPFGTVSTAQHSQFGQVSLEADGRVDDSFKSLAGATNSADWIDIKDPALTKFIAAERQLANGALTLARESFESGQEIKPYERGDQHGKFLREAFSQSGMKGSAHCQTDWRGVITHTTINFQDSKGNYSQGLSISHKGIDTVANLVSRRNDGVHEISVPVNFDGSLNLEQGQETLKLNTPWLSDGSLRYVANEGIKSLEDPRLERLASAADQGFHLSPTDMGPGWKCETDGTRQTWTVSNQKVVLDSKDRSLEVSAHGWGTGHAGSSDCSIDYDIDSAVKWQGGQMTRVK